MNFRKELELLRERRISVIRKIDRNQSIEIMFNDLLNVLWTEDYVNVNRVFVHLISQEKLEQYEHIGESNHYYRLSPCDWNDNGLACHLKLVISEPTVYSNFRKKLIDDNVLGFLSCNSDVFSFYV